MRNDTLQVTLVLLVVSLLFALSGIAIYDFTPAHPYFGTWVPVHADPESFARQERLRFLTNQAGYWCLGFTLFFACYRWQRLLSRSAAACSALALVVATLPLLPVVGLSIRGCRRHFLLGDLAIYSAPWALLAAAFAFGRLCAASEKKGAAGLLPPALLYAALSALFLLQPDAPMLLILNAMVLALILSGDLRGGARVKLALAGALGIGAMELFFPLLKASPLGPMLQRLGHRGAYQTWLALNDLRLGGLFGTGLGTFHLGEPLYPADTMSRFILQITGREFGLAGMLVVLLLFGLLAWLCLRRIGEIPSPVQQKSATALLTLVLLPLLLGLARTLDLLPLSPSYDIPFLGYGAASVLFPCCALGAIFSPAVASAPAIELPGTDPVINISKDNISTEAR